jgi:hypothetical protein
MSKQKYVPAESECVSTLGLGENDKALVAGEGL